jgi:hypothetical protein
MHVGSNRATGRERHPQEEERLPRSGDRLDLAEDLGRDAGTSAGCRRPVLANIGSGETSAEHEGTDQNE